MGDVELRPASMDDVPAIGALVRRAQAHDRVPQVLTDEELTDDLSASYVDLDLDTRVAERGGEVVGWAQVWHPGSADQLDRADLFGEVAPAHRGQGIGRALLGWSVQRAEERLRATTHSLPRFIAVYALDSSEDRQRLFRRFGFEPRRWDETLVRPLTDLPEVPTPDGVRLEPWPEDDEETLEVRNETFRDHVGSTTWPPEVWHQAVRGHGGRPDLSFVAVNESTGRLVGICLNHSYPEDEPVTGRKDGIVDVVGTRREARGRGVASALIARSLQAFVEDGLDHAAIDVDSQNPSGAARLYRALGFELDHRSISYAIALDEA